jgi:hypothetical protein
MDHLPLPITDVTRLLRVCLSPSTGVFSPVLWGNEAFSIAPFCTIDGQTALAETTKGTYLCTPEHIAPATPLCEITLIARGALTTTAPSGTIRRVPWEVQLTTTYHFDSGCLALWIRPEVHWEKASGETDTGTVMYGWRLRSDSNWLAHGKHWASSPKGALVSSPMQEGVSTVATAMTFTMLADETAVAALLLIDFPRDHCASSHTMISAGRLASTRTTFKVDYPGLRYSAAPNNGLPIASSWTQAQSLVHITPPSGSLIQKSFHPAPSFASDVVNSQAPGRYQCLFELRPESMSEGTALHLAFPFRFWPDAPQHRPQAEFGQLLLTTDLGSDFIAAFNFVHPTDVYLADDRDDVLAEQASLACVLGQRLNDPDLVALATRMVERLLLHQQPDGGFTFGVSVNGFRADYADTNADVIQCLLTLARSPQASCVQSQRWVRAAWRAANFMLTFQDPSGFFWGRTDRPDVFRYGNQPWFTGYATVACLELCIDRKAYGIPADELNETAPMNLASAKELLAAAERGLHWLCQVQDPGGWFRFDCTGYYADYDDLSNTSVSVWALCRACQLLPHHPDAIMWWATACRGVAHLLSLEQPAGSGQFSGHGLPHVQKLVYDYKLGAAWQNYLQLRSAGWLDSDNPPIANIAGMYQRYLQHVRRIQGLGTLTGGWASLYSLTEQAYLADHEWFEHGSKWQQYVFLGWQGKMVLLDIPS